MKPSEWIKNRMKEHYGKDDGNLSRQVLSILDYLDEVHYINVAMQDNVLYQDIKGAIYSNIKYAPTPDDITMTTEKIMNIVKHHLFLMKEELR